MAEFHPRLKAVASAFAILAVFCSSPLWALDRTLAVLSEELIGTPSTLYNHASTIAEAKDGTLLVAWYGGTAEGMDDVSIWLSRKQGSGAWSAITSVDDGRRDDGNRYACWNPVLITAKSGAIYLFYKISSVRASVTLSGYQNWWGCVKTSTDNGLTWSARQWLPTNNATIFNTFGHYLPGPIKNKPIELPDGDLLSGSSTEIPPSGAGNPSWQVHFEIGAAGNWVGNQSLVGPLPVTGAIQPTFLILSSDYRNLQMICRQQSGTNPFTATSSDMGRTWTSLTRLTGITTNVGLDAVTLSNGWHILAHNPSPNRYPLAVARSQNGTAWEEVLPSLDVNGTNSMDYPAIIQTADGRIHVTHSWGRSAIKHLVLDQYYLTGTSPTRMLSGTPEGNREYRFRADAEMAAVLRAGRVSATLTDLSGKSRDVKVNLHGENLDLEFSGALRGKPEPGFYALSLAAGKNRITRLLLLR